MVSAPARQLLGAAKSFLAAAPRAASRSALRSRACEPHNRDPAPFEPRLRPVKRAEEGDLVPTSLKILEISRLKTRPDFLRVARGRRYAVPGLVLQSKKNPAPEPGHQACPSVRVGFTTTKKIGNAVFRNRVRRRLRAAAAKIMPEAAQPGFDYVLIGRAGTFDRPWQSLLDDLTLALQMVHQPKAKKTRSKRPRDDTPGTSKT
jgi:ribonuclease P protein component